MSLLVQSFIRGTVQLLDEIRQVLLSGWVIILVCFALCILLVEVMR